MIFVLTIVFLILIFVLHLICEIKQVDGETEERVETVYNDYLTPYLKHIDDSDNMTREEAQRVMEECIEALKNRMYERANIIQQRLDQENASLQKKQAAFKRSQDQADGADEEYERECAEHMFRIQVISPFSHLFSCHSFDSFVLLLQFLSPFSPFSPNTQRFFSKEKRDMKKSQFKSMRI